MAVQVKLELVNTPVLGLTPTLTTEGERLSMLTAVLDEAVPPLESLTDAVQVTTSVGIAPVLDKSSVAPVYVVPLTDHSTVGVTVSSASVAVALHERTESLLTLVLGEINTLDTTGSELEIVIVSSA